MQKSSLIFFFIFEHQKLTTQKLTHKYAANYIIQNFEVWLLTVHLAQMRYEIHRALKTETAPATSQKHTADLQRHALR